MLSCLHSACSKHQSSLELKYSITLSSLLWNSIAIPSHTTKTQIYVAIHEEVKTLGTYHLVASLGGSLQLEQLQEALMLKTLGKL